MKAKGQCANLSSVMAFGVKVAILARLRASKIYADTHV